MCDLEESWQFPMQGEVLETGAVDTHSEQNSKVLDLEKQLAEALEEINELEHQRRALLEEINELEQLAQIRKHERDKWEDKYMFVRDIANEALQLLDAELHITYSEASDEYDDLVSKLDWIAQQ